MKNLRRKLIAFTVSLPMTVGLLGLASAPATAQEQPLKIIVPYSAGGSGDAIARMLTDGMREHLGRMVIVENRPGANGRIALNALKSAPSDGSTVLLAFNGVMLNFITFQGPKDLVFKDEFVGLAQVGRVPAALALPPQHKANNVNEFIAMRKQAGDFTYGNNGQGSMTHLAGLRFAAATNLKANPIGYQGGAPMANDIMGGQIDAGIDTAGDFVERNKGKKIKVIGVFGNKRFHLLPDVPTMAEQGVENVEAEIWLGFLASNKVSDAFSKRFQDAVKKTLEIPSIKEKASNILELDYLAKEDFSKVISKDFETWTPLVTAAGLVNK